MGASATQTGLGAPEGAEPPSRLGATPAIPSAGAELRASIWSGHFRKQEGDPARCRASVPEGGRSPMFHQCRRKPTVFRDCTQPPGRFGFCSLHDPVAVDAKRAERDAQWRREWDERDARIKAIAERKKATEQCIAALREIAAGHNDARGLAAEVLARLDACDSDGSA